MGSTRGDLLAELGEVARELDVLEPRVAVLSARRITLWARGRALSPPLLVRELADASVTTEGAVTQALHRMRTAEEASA